MVNFRKIPKVFLQEEDAEQKRSKRIFYGRFFYCTWGKRTKTDGSGQMRRGLFEAKKIYGRQPFRLAIRSFSEGWWWSNKLNLQSLYAQNSERFLRMTANSSLTKSSQKFSIKQKSIDTCYSVSNQLSSN